MSQALLDFRVELPPGDVVMLGDAQGISRLLSILLENASKYTPPGGSVLLRAAVEGECVILSVRDTGIGIAPEHRSRIFDRFYRGAQASESVAPGSGLGLALGKWIAERHGAKLSFESEPGRGTCFSFALKRTCPNPLANPAFRSAPSESKAQLKMPSSRAL
jgi:signal transduction histidine kinase